MVRRSVIHDVSHASLFQRNIISRQSAKDAVAHHVCVTLTGRCAAHTFAIRTTRVAGVTAPVSNTQLRANETLMNLV